MGFKYILFDMDGVLVDSERLSLEIWRDFFERSGYSFGVSDYVRFIGAQDAAIKAMTKEFFPNVDLKKLYETWESAFEQHVSEKKLPAKRGAYELFAELDKKGIKRAVASSNSLYWVKKNLASVDLLDRVDAIATADIVESCKPAPDLFLKAAKLLGAKPSECLAIEDSRSGLLSANAAGCKLEFIPDLVSPPDEVIKLCDYVFDSLLDVIALI